MWYAITAVLVLIGLLVVGRLLARWPEPVAISVRIDPELLAAPSPRRPHYVPLRHLAPPALRPAPGAPNIDHPTDRHVTARGTATITKRTGRRTSTGV